MYPFRAYGLLVEQPFGQFVVVKLPARVLLDTAYSDRLKAVEQPDGKYRLEGSQRELMIPRLRQIGQFIDKCPAFPNAIILAANYREDDNLIEEDEDRKWSLTPALNGDVVSLTIPQKDKLAPIIDGQHRLFGFNYTSKPERLDMPLVCAIYFDLPKPYQAFLFATINSNQRPVSKSQTYELFGYNVEDESPESWTSEKFAVFLARKLNLDTGSPFHLHVVVPAVNEITPTLSEARQQGSWAVSTATVVEGIVRLISSNPKLDAYQMAGEVRYEGKDRSVLAPARDQQKTPLRELFKSKNDDLIYAAINNYFTAVNELFWQRASANSYIRKTVGLQALFDVSRPLLFEAVQAKDLRGERFSERLRPASHIDFADPFFQASGTGRQRIRSCIELCLRLRTLQEVRGDQESYRRICRLAD